MGVLLDWFDLNGAGASFGPAGGPQLSLVEQLLLYLVVVIGVVLSEAVAMARSGGPIRIRLDRPWLVVACVVALVVFPAVWREIGSLPETSLLVQLGVAAQGGVFWGVVMAGAEKGVTARSSDDSGRRVVDGGLRVARVTAGVDPDEHHGRDRERGDADGHREARTELDQARPGEGIDDEVTGQ
jgi:hypothetical protein